jgi:hypothetical protein
MKLLVVVKLQLDLAEMTQELINNVGSENKWKIKK